MGETGAPRFGWRSTFTSPSDSCSARVADILLRVRIIVLKNSDVKFVNGYFDTSKAGQQQVLALLVLMLMIEE